MRSIIFSLIDPIAYCILNRALPNNGIKFLGHETLNPTSFPGWPSFGDILYDENSNTIVGMTFHIHPQSDSIAKSIVRKMSPAITQLKKVKTDADLNVYRDYPDSTWLEIKWSPVPPSQIIDVQSCNVLWYQDSNPQDQTIPIAFGIEDLDYLTKQTDFDMRLPSHFPFQHLAIKFLND